MSDAGERQAKSAVDSGEYRKLKRKRRKREVLKLKLKIATGLIVAAIVLIVFGILYANDVFYRKAAVSTLTVGADGAITLEEVQSVQGIPTTKADIRASVKDAIATYEKGKGAGTVKLKTVKVKNDKAYVRTTYDSAKTYSDFSGYNLYAGKAGEAKKSDYDFDTSFYPVKDGAFGDAVGGDEIEKLDTFKAVIVNESIHIRVPGTVKYVSSYGTTLEDKNETGVSRDVKNDGTTAPPDTYVLYK